MYFIFTLLVSKPIILSVFVRRASEQSHAIEIIASDFLEAARQIDEQNQSSIGTNPLQNSEAQRTLFSSFPNCSDPFLLDNQANHSTSQNFNTQREPLTDSQYSSSTPQNSLQNISSSPVYQKRQDTDVNEPVGYSNGAVSFASGQRTSLLNLYVPFCSLFFAAVSA